MGIGSYKEAERYRMRTNKNLTRSFYLDTRRTLDEEPFAWEQTQDAGIMQPGAVQGFARGGIVSNEERLEKLKQIVLESNSNPFKSISKNQAVLSAGYKNPSNLEARRKIKDLLDTLVPLEEKFSNHLNNVMNNLDNIPYQEIIKEGGLNKYVSKPFGVDRIAGSRKISNAYSKPEFKEARDIVRLLSNAQVFETYGNKEMFAGEVLDNLDVKKSATRLRGGKLEDDIINVAMRSAEAGNKNIKFLTKPGTVDASDIVFEWNGKLYGKNVDEYKGKKVNNLTTDLYKLPEFNEYLESRNKLEDLKGKQVIHPVTGRETNYDQLLRETYAKGFDNDSFYKFSGLDLDHKDIKNKPFSDVRPLPRHINAAASPLNKKTFSIVKDKEKFLQDVGYNIPEESLEKSIVDFSDRVLNKKIPINKTYQSGLQSITGASKEYLTPLSKIETEGLEMEKKGAKEFVKGETQVMTSSGLRPVSEKETKIPKEFNEQKKNTVEYLTDYLNKNPEEIKILKGVGIPCRRSTGGKVDVECLAENVVKEVEKLGTGTELQKTSVINKFNNAFKRGSGLAEEILGFGKGVVGRTLLPLTALNSALEQWTSGNYREGVRKIADLLDITTLVGDPLGFEKSRQEARIEEVRNKIGKENQASLDRILEFKDKYYQLQDVNTKLERAESATQDPNAAPESYDPDYISDLKKQQTDLNKIINSPKYQNFRTDASNVAKAIKDEIFKRNVNRPQQERYTNEIAAQEQFKSIIGEDIYNEIPDVTEPIYKNLTASEKRQKEAVPFETPEIQLPDDSMMRQEFKKGGISRRDLLALLTGAAVAPELIKSIGGTKKAAQTAKVTSKINIEPAEGMYEWFPKLVEKVKKMGEPFEEKELIMEPSYKNSPRPFTSRPPTGEEKLTKHVDGDTTFILREYPDGRIAVDIDSPRNQQSYGQPVSLYYRPKMEFKNYKGEKKIEPPEFKVLEPEPRPFVNGPDDVDITFTEIPKNPERNVVYGDIEAAERFATGKIKNRKIIPVKQSLRNEMEEEPSTFIMRQSGELGSEARPEQIIKIPEEKATGGRVGFSGGGHPAIKFARMITDLLGSLKKDLSFSSHLVKLHGPEVAKKEMISPYRIPEGTNKSKQSDILMRIDEIKQNLPKEYSGLINTLDDIEKNVNNYNYIDASKKGTVLLEKLPDSFNFEKLPQDLFPMEDPLNDAFILFDPKREKMVGRYTMRYAVDPETGKGIIQTYDTYDPASKKFLEEKDWKLIGVDAREESGEITKKGLN